jgi:D-3-phosphoglycerate dehydrogenase / 2-oxoglutarate reductase
LAGYLTALKFNVNVFDPYVQASKVEQAGCKPSDLDQVLAASDAVSLHMPLVDATHHIINSHTIAKMKDHAILINTARGPLVDSEALVHALNGEKLGGAVLDVFEQEPLLADSPLFSAKNLTMTPHIAWYTEESTARLKRSAGEEIARALQGQSLRCPLT